MSANFSNWILIADGDSINLDFVAKVMWGGDFKGASPPTTRLYIFHGGVPGSTGVTGASTAYDYGDADVAKGMRDKINQLLVDNGATDLRSKPTPPTKDVPAPAPAGPVFSAGSPTTMTALAANPPFTLTGTGLKAVTHLKFDDGGGNAFQAPVTVLSSTTLQFPANQQASVAAATYTLYFSKDGGTTWTTTGLTVVAS